MEVVRIETTIPKDGKVDLSVVPVGPEEKVEIIVLYGKQSPSARTRESMLGTVLKYERPFDPVFDENEFDAIRRPESVIEPNEPEQ
jgi:hypothetical protein